MATLLDRSYYRWRFLSHVPRSCPPSPVILAIPLSGVGHVRWLRCSSGNMLVSQRRRAYRVTTHTVDRGRR